MPRRLYGQLVCLVSVIVILTVTVYGWFTGSSQSQHALKAMKLHAEVMAKNISDSSADYLLTSNFAGLEILLFQTAEFADVLEIQVCDRDGNMLSNIVRTQGSAPRAFFNRKTLKVPSSVKTFIEIRNKRIIIWQPISSGSLLGWVRIEHGMEDIYEMQKNIWKNSLLAGLIGILSSFILLLIALRRPVGAIQRVADFAKRLHTAKGEQIPVEQSSLEIEQLCESLNETSLELHTKEKLLLSERERLAVTLQSIGDGVIATDTEGKVVLTNRVSEYLTGWNMQEASGRPLAEVFLIINEKTRQPAENPVEKVLKTGTIIGLANHTALISKDGKERSIADSAAPITDREGKIIGVVLVFRDITEKNKMEEELLRSRKLESLGTLAGGIAHDFNNILTAVLGNISIAESLVNEEDAIYKRLATAEKATLRARDLAQQLLTFSRGGAPILKTVHIGDLLRETVTFSLSGSNVKADTSVPDNLWFVDIDEGQMSQVIQNLVINARESMPAGGTLTAAVENMIIGDKSSLPLAAGSYVSITVADQGAGISKEHLPMIFDPYFTTKERGSGLGLATVYSIIKRHNGHITVESGIRAGTTFHIYIPASQAEQADTKDMLKESLSADIRNKKILVMDDDEFIRDFIGEVLSPFGHKIDFAADGKEAVNLYKHAMGPGQPYDAVIMDLTTPGGMGGKETMKMLVDMDPGIKAIVSSGYSNDPVMAKFREYGFSGVVTKPYKSEELVALLNRILMDNS